MINTNLQKTKQLMEAFKINSHEVANRNFEQIKHIAKPIKLEVFENYFLLMKNNLHLKNKKVLNKCAVYEMFGHNSRMVYEKYDCIDVDTININSNKIFVNIMVGVNTPENFIDDMIANIKSNLSASAIFSHKITVIDDIKNPINNPQIEVIYSLEQEQNNQMIFDEDELVDIYNSLSALSINSKLQEKVKRILTS